MSLCVVLMSLCAVLIISTFRPFYHIACSHIEMTKSINVRLLFVEVRVIMYLLNYAECVSHSQHHRAKVKKP